MWKKCDTEIGKQSRLICSLYAQTMNKFWKWEKLIWYDREKTGEKIKTYCSSILFQNIFKFCTILPKLWNILPFSNISLPFFLKNHLHEDIYIWSLADKWVIKIATAVSADKAEINHNSVKIYILIKEIIESLWALFLFPKKIELDFELGSWWSCFCPSRIPKEQSW